MPTAKDVIRVSLNMGEKLIRMYFEDLGDDDLAETPIPGMNPAAWQIGHVIAVEHGAMERLRPGSCPPLPSGFEAAHSRDVALQSAFQPVLSKAGYLELWDAQRSATRKVLESLSDEELDAETGVAFAPTVFALMNLMGTHPILHAGQLVAARRKSGKPVVF